MEFDVALLSRIQFGLTIAFHYLYPPLSIGLGLLLVFMEGMYLVTKKPIYEVMTKFWTKIFGLSFAMGVASGIVMEFQFGTNWANYSRFVGDVFGSALAAEGIFAFFLESGFLAVLLFGWDKVSPRTHFFSTVMVALGSMFSAIWIVVANSWQQTPAGHRLVEFAGRIRAETVDFWQVVFNPSSMIRLTHTLIGAYILASFFVMSICAYYILKRRHEAFARRGFVIALVLAAVSSLAQLMTGHIHGQVVAKYQPAKLAAFEGLFETTARAPIHLFGLPDVESGTVKMSVGVPGALSFLATNDMNGIVKGLNEFPKADWPPVVPSFLSFHTMVGLGMYFIAITLLALFMLWRGKLFETKWLMWVFVFSVILPYIANEIGWFAAEIGRQPWTVYGLLRTADSISPAVKWQEVMTSLVLFTFIYLALFLLFLFVLDRKIKAGPEDEEGITHHEPTGPADLIDAMARRGKSEYGQIDK